MHKNFSNLFCLTISAYTLLFATAFSHAQTQDVAPPDHWTPENAVAFALKNSPDSKIALERIKTAEAENLLSQAAIYPTIGLHSSYGQTNNPMYSFGNILNQGEFDNNIDFNNPGRTDNLNLKADIAYRFYNGGSTSAAIMASEANVEASELEYQGILNRLAFEVVRSFQSIIQAQDMLKAEQLSLQAVEASLQVATARYDEGDLLREDVLSLEVHKARASENIINADHRLKLAQQSFYTLLGLKDTAIDVNCTNLTQQVPEQLSYSGRPELLVIEKRIAAAHALVKKEKGAKMPTIDGFASYQYDHGFELDGSGDSWMAGVKMDYTLYEGKQTAARIARAQSQLLQTKRLKTKTELSLNLELQQAELGYQQAKERKNVTGKMVEVAMESARLSRIRFKEGVILSSNLIDVEMRLSDALLRHSVAKSAYRIAIANLRRATGLPQFTN